MAEVTELNQGQGMGGSGGHKDSHAVGSSQRIEGIRLARLSFLGKLSGVAREGFDLVKTKKIAGEPDSTNLAPLDTNNLSSVTNKKAFEEVFAKPEDSVLVSRTAFPLGNDKKSWDFVLENNCPRWPEDQRVKYKAFATALKNSVGAAVRCKLYLHLMLQLKESNITLRGKRVDNLDELFRSWTTETVTEAKCEGLFSILYGSLERDNVFATIEIETLLEHGLYFSAADNCVNRVTVGGRVCYSMIWQTTRNKVRDIFRNRYSRTNLVPHGIKLTVSKRGKDAARSKRNNKKGEFIFSENVTGWMGQKHTAFNMRFLADNGGRDESSGSAGAGSSRVSGRVALASKRNNQMRLLLTFTCVLILV